MRPKKNTQFRGLYFYEKNRVFKKKMKITSVANFQTQYSQFSKTESFS